MDEKIKLEKLKILEETYADAIPELEFNSVFELLVVLILSAQCTALMGYFYSGRKN